MEAAIGQVLAKASSWIKTIDGRLQFVDPIDGIEISAHYGATHMAASMILWGNCHQDDSMRMIGLSLLESILDRWDTNVKLPAFHFDFNNFALCLVYDALDNSDEDLKKRIFSTVVRTPDSNHTDGNLTMYPDRSYSVQALVKKPDASSNIRYSDITYQWQKKDSKNHWNKLMDENSDTLSIADPVADHTGEYRCRIDIEAYDQTAKKKFNATVFTDVFTLTFAHRPVQIDAFSVSSDGQFPN